MEAMMIKRLTSPEQIWMLHSQQSDRQLAADYAEKTVPWTFNRMMLQGPRGLKERAINISKGIAGQQMLQRAFQARGRQYDIQLKSHRADDLFDFRIPINGEDMRLDIKTTHYFTDYQDDVRNPLNSNLIITHRSYPGPDWRYFFPMMIPHTQIRQDKEVYCFAIASSADPRKRVTNGDSETRLCAFAYGPHQHFFSNKKLCLQREANGKGFYIRCHYNPCGLFATEQVALMVIGEWQEQPVLRTVSIQADRPSEVIGPFSIIDAFKISYSGYFALANTAIEVECVRNDYNDPVRNSKGENINKLPSSFLQLHQDNFSNIMLPDDYTLYVLGWISKSDYLQRCRTYPSWVWPNDKVNKFHNQHWSQITQDDEIKIRNVGFDDCIFRSPSRFLAGWMKTSGHGNGACCYVFPNVHQRGGVNETNLYVLPQDLNIMDDLL
jgi:hypothetical protein